jgi:BTB/POZ domain
MSGLAHLREFQVQGSIAAQKLNEGNDAFQRLITDAEKAISEKLAAAETNAAAIAKVAEETKNAADEYRDAEHAKVKEERRHWEEEKAMTAKTQHLDPQVKLDIGGHTFTTTLTTLTRIPDSMLGAMFSGRHKLEKSESGAYFIDRDGTHFRHILNYLRAPENFDNALLSSSELLQLQREATYYGLNELMFPTSKRSYKVNQNFVEESGNRVKLAQTFVGRWHLIYMGYGDYGIGSGYDAVVTVCTTCNRGFGTPDSVGICLSLPDFNDATRDLKSQPKVKRCQFCKYKSSP